MTSPRQALRQILAAVLIGAVAWAGGFAWYLLLVNRPARLPARADGIVALTGGPARVETALRLLAEGRADRLLLSGIGGGAELNELAHRAGLDPMPLVSKVTLGRTAMSTRGNAAETAAWIERNAIQSLIVVTASYHMPRALAELRRTAPGVTLFPDPVPSAAPPPTRGAPLPLLAEEYTKYLLAAVGVSGWLPDRDPPSPHGGRSG
ncbi:MAG: YdcF family protein [Acetobacteraceae bacterium]|nr:YdcF family protein [Acetobacteraceae bacterium]